MGHYVSEMGTPTSGERLKLCQSKMRLEDKFAALYVSLVFDKRGRFLLGKSFRLVRKKR